MLAKTLPIIQRVRLQTTNRGVTHAGSTRRIVQPHVARGDAPERRGTVENERVEAVNGRAVQGPLVGDEHFGDEVAVLATGTLILRWI